jgi:hypothetical protein
MQNQTTITITFKNPINSMDNFALVWLTVGHLARKAIVNRHTYETEAGVFTVSKSKTINIKER